MSEHIEGTIVHLNKGTPKPSKWFSGRMRTLSGDIVSVAGNASVFVQVGMSIEFDGELVNSTYGDQYQPEMGKLINRRLTTRFEIVSFLKSKVFPGVGDVIAQRIYDMYGANTMHMLETDLSTVVQTCKLNKRVAEVIAQGISSTSGLGKLKYAFPHMRQYLLDRILDAKQFQELDAVILDIQNNPYEMLCGDTGFGASLYDADEIAIEDIGMTELCKTRLDMIMFDGISRFMEDRNATYVRIDCDDNYREYNMFFNTYVRRVKLYKQLPYRLDDGTIFDANYVAGMFYSDWINPENRLSCVVSERRQNKDGTSEFDLYQKRIFFAEKSLVSFLSKAFEESMTPSYVGRTMRFMRWFKKRQDNGEFTGSFPDKTQIEAVQQVFESKLSLLSGGPGRGKTAILKILVRAWQECVGTEVFMLAPTGKAVNKLKDATGYSNAETIKRFLVINRAKQMKKQRDYVFDMYSNPLHNDMSTLVIVDEASMIDFVDASNLLSIINECTVVFVGDKDQLAPISPGSFLCELLRSRKIHLSFLTKNYRTNIPELASNADLILSGGKVKDFTLTENFNVVPSSEVSSDGISLSPAEQYVLDEYMDKLALGADFSDILVISPFAKSKYGLSAGQLNVVLQNKLNPVFPGLYTFGNDEYGQYVDKRGKEISVIDKAGKPMRIGDRLINNRNNMDIAWHSYTNDDFGKRSALNDPDEPEVNQGVFNGDMGTLLRYYQGDTECPPHLLIELDQKAPSGLKRFVRIPCEYVNNVWRVNDWTLGYVLSVHKAQGSEAKHVILVLSESGFQAVSWRSADGVAPFLTRNLLYTAVTRAQESVCIVGSLTALQACMDTPYVFSNVRLGQLLRDA